MKEFEIRYKESGEIDLLYGYNAKDLIKRYPNISPDSYVILGSWYVD